MRRAAVLAGVAALGLALGLFTLLRPRRGDAPPSEAPAPAEEAVVAEPHLQARALPSTPLETAVTKGDVTGTVVDAKGAPVARVHITARADLEPSRPGRMLSDPRGIAITDEEGRFTVRGLTTGTYVVEARGEDVVPTAIFATTGDVAAKIELLGPPRSSAPSVLVLDAAGRPLRGALVSLGGMREITDAEGRVRFPPVELKGINGLHVKPPASRPDLQPLFVGDWTRRDDTLRLEAALTIRGRVVDTEGRPVSKADVFNASGTDSMQRQALDTTDREGRFQVPRLRAGTPMRIFARPNWIPDDAANSATVDVVAGDDEVVLRVDLGVDLTVKIEGAAEAQANVAIVARETESPWGGVRHQEPVWRDGNVKFRGLRRNATYAVWIPPGREGGPCGYATGRRASDEALVMQLSPSLAVEGRLLGNAPVTSGHVFLHAAAIGTSGEVAEDGTFRVGGLPDTRLRLFASVDLLTRGEPNWVAEGEVAAGTRVELSLKPTGR